MTNEVSGGDDLVPVTVTAVMSDQGTVVLFKGDSPGDTVWFYVGQRAAAGILEALRAGETPVADVPYWAILGCPEWCMYDDLHDEEKRARVEAEGYGSTDANND